MAIRTKVVVDQRAVDSSTLLPDLVAGSRAPELARRGSRRLPAYLWPLGLVLTIQALLSLRLLAANSAFLDEATYLTAGHELLRAVLHGGPNLHFATYLSGSPVLYPTVGALANAIGGLTAARLLSLLFMLIATCLAYDTGRRLFGAPAGLFAAATFVTVEGTLFLGAFATFDALALMLIAVAAWLVVRAGLSDRPRGTALIFAAAPVLALANATKYASTLYDIVVIALAFFLLAGRDGRRAAARTTVCLAAQTVGILAAALAFAGRDYLQGIGYTTLLRPRGSDPATTVIVHSAMWIGVLALLALLTSGLFIAGMLRRRLSPAATGVVVTLGIATILAPVVQMRMHDLTSLHKHVTFGAWFGALAVGYGAAWFVGRPARKARAVSDATVNCAAARTDASPPRPPRRRRRALRYSVLLATLAALLVVGAAQSRRLFASWSNSGRYVATMQPLVAETRGPVLADDAPVLEYYLGRKSRADRWFDTFYETYRSPRSRRLYTGPRALAQAIKENYFSLVAVDFGEYHHDVHRAIRSALERNHRYRFVAAVPVSDAISHGAYLIWRLDGQPDDVR